MGLPVAAYLTWEGVLLEGKGVEPDHVVELSPDGGPGPYGAKAGGEFNISGVAPALIVSEDEITRMVEGVRAVLMQLS